MNESSQILVIAIFSTKFLWKHDDHADEGELGVSHVELIEIQIVAIVWLLDHPICGSHSRVRTDWHGLDVLLDGRQHGTVAIE